MLRSLASWVIGALMVESLTMAARSAALVIPGGFGVQEGSLLLLGPLIGLSPQTALALPLVKRAREVMSGPPALAFWWHLLVAVRQAHSAEGSDMRS